MTLPRAILIDLDDTIIDDSGSVDISWIDVCAVAASREALDGEELRIAIKQHASWWWSDADRHRRGRLDLRSATTEIVTGALAELGHDRHDLAFEIANHYRDLREERATLLPGAVETLEWLRDQGVKLGMMTNGAGPAQRAKIERFELTAHFEHIIVEGEFGCGKPDPRVFQTLLTSIGVSATDAWAVGDNLTADVYGAMDIGIHGIWIDPTDRGVPVDWREPDRTVRWLRELML